MKRIWKFAFSTDINWYLVKSLDHVSLKSGNFAEKTYFVCSKLSKVLQISFHFKKTYWYGKSLKRHGFAKKKPFATPLIVAGFKKENKTFRTVFIKLKRSKNRKRLILNLWKWATLRNPKRRILRGLKNIVLNFSTKLLGMKVGSINTTNLSFHNYFCDYIL